MLVPGHTHDLFLSYAHADADWVELFKKAFCKEFHERDGNPVSIWQDSSDLRPGAKWTIELEQGVKNAAALLAIVSPPYQNCGWCAEERRFLLQHYGGLEGLKVDNLYRLLKIVKHPTQKVLLGELQDVARFFHSGTGEPIPHGSPEFKVAVVKAVTAIRELFRLMSNGKTSVYLASCSIEMADERRQLKDQLTAFNYKVRPAGLVLDESYGNEALVEELEPCSRAIFLLGGSYDKFMETQIQQAIALDKPCLFWIHPRLAQTQSLLEQVRGRLKLPSGSEILVAQSIPALWDNLKSKLKDSSEPRTARRATDDKLRVYLIFDASLTTETEAAAQLSGILSERHLEVIESRSFDQHRDLMSTSDAALLLRTSKPEPDDWWLNILAPEVILSKQFASKALVLADSKRLKQDPGDVPVLAYSNPFSPQALDPFIEKLKRAKGAHASG